MKDKIMLIIKGMIIGVANIIPGVSGGTLAITLGLYERIIDCINHIKTNFKEKLRFLIFLGIGVITALIIGSRLIEFGFNNYPFATTMFFVGLVLGGIPFIYHKVRRKKTKISYYLAFLLAAGLVISMYFIKSSDNMVSFSNMNILSYLKLIIIGMIAAATMVVPGISGSLMLMTLGYYKPILNVINETTRFNNIFSNILILIPFGIGIVLGIILVARLIEYLFKKHETITYYAILGFLVSSVIVIILPLFTSSMSAIEFVVGIILLLVGSIVADKVGEK